MEMFEIQDLLEKILSELQDLNMKLDEIKGNDDKSIDDICEKLDRIYYSMR